MCLDFLIVFIEAAIHPLVQAILEAEQPTAPASVVTLSRNLLEALSEEVRKDPTTAYNIGLTKNRYEFQIEDETEEHYAHRVFMVAFSGRYLDGQRKKSFPAPLQDLQPSPKEFFRRLAYECINSRMYAAIDNFSITTSKSDLKDFLLSQNQQVTDDTLHMTYEYLDKLVRHPKTLASIIWQQIGGNLGKGAGEKTLSLIDPLVRKLGIDRAEAACAVLQEPWCSSWLPAHRLLEIIQARIKEQRPVADTCTTLGISRGSYAVGWGDIILLLPAVRKLIPRPVRGRDKTSENE